MPYTGDNAISLVEYIALTEQQSRTMAPARLAALLLALQGVHVAASTRHTWRSGTEVLEQLHHVYTHADLR